MKEPGEEGRGETTRGEGGGGRIVATPAGWCHEAVKEKSMKLITHFASFMAHN